MFIAYFKDYLSPNLLAKVIKNYNACGLFPTNTFIRFFKIANELGYFLDFKYPMTKESVEILSAELPKREYYNEPYDKYYDTIVNNNPKISIAYLPEREISDNRRITELEDRLRLAASNLSYVNSLLEQQIKKVSSFDRFFDNLEEEHKESIRKLEEQIQSIQEERDNMISLIKIFSFDNINRKYSVDDIADLKLYVFGGSYGWQSNIIKLSKKIYCYTTSSPSFTKEEIDQADFIIIHYKEVDLEHLYQIKNLADESKLIFVFDNKISSFINAVAERKFFKYSNRLKE